MQIFLFCLFIAGITVVDQWTKWLVVENIPLYGHVDAIPGLFHFTYTQNTGAAFSSFDGMRWLFVLIFLVFAVAMILELVTKRFGLTKFEHWCLVAILGGGLGNMIDRVFLGEVIDFLSFIFWGYEFYVFVGYALK